ncbi:SOS response-associated peptidase family protein [uncultured Microbacterium sp.]|uniref:SOS response-associated peptidase family protein n=1 Tax=uncultured Microbacterium sp. TaxID=191216 RepID=UPI00261E9CD9|nr:SOS response-associated peptidase family protein [uncultured Microbacterium sp.]
MCASYGLDPRFTDVELLAEQDAAMLEGLREWAEHNAGETLRPTGRNRRNLNPLIAPGPPPVLQPGWWGHLVDGAPAPYPSINTRSERLQQRPGALRHRAIVPASGWLEMRKPERVWHEFGLGPGIVFGMAAVTQHGRTADGEEYTCYSLVMRPSPPHLADVHDRMPVLIPTSFADEWLRAGAGRGVIDDALVAAASLDERVRATARADDRGAAERLF